MRVGTWCAPPGGVGRPSTDPAGLRRVVPARNPEPGTLPPRCPGGRNGAAFASRRQSWGRWLCGQHNAGTRLREDSAAQDSGSSRDRRGQSPARSDRAQGQEEEERVHRSGTPGMGQDKAGVTALAVRVKGGGAFTLCLYSPRRSRPGPRAASSAGRWVRRLTLSSGALGGCGRSQGPLNSAGSWGLPVLEAGHAQDQARQTVVQPSRVCQARSGATKNNSFGARRGSTGSEGVVSLDMVLPPSGRPDSLLRPLTPLLCLVI